MSAEVRRTLLLRFAGCINPSCGFGNSNYDTTMVSWQLWRRDQTAKFRQGNRKRIRPSTPHRQIRGTRRSRCGGFSSQQGANRSTHNGRLVEPKHLVDRVAKLFQARLGDNDAVVMIVSTFGNPQERALHILSQIKCELLPLDLKMGLV